MSRHEVDDIDVDRASHVTIRFSDGVTARYGIAELRLACPCAECNGKRQQNMPVQARVEQGDVVTITEATLSGAFGLNLDWSDGHRTGIYAWSLFRDGLDNGTLGTEI